MKVRFSSNALRRIQQIMNFNGSKKGKRIANEIFDRADELEKFPKLGPIEERFESLEQGHRSLLVGKLYKIIYLIKKPIIFITDVFDVRQDPDKMKP